MKPVRVINWINLNDVERFEDAKKIIASPIYDEAPFDEAHKDAIIKELVDRHYLICGDTHQSRDVDGIPLFEDGYILVSMRVWGGLMAEAVNVVRHTDKYTYTDFYMASTCKFNEEYHGEE